MIEETLSTNISNENPIQTEWTEIIGPKNNWLDLHLGERWRYRDLVMLFVWRDFVSVYKQTILGPLWHIIQPILTALTFYVIFGRIAQLSTDGQPQFLFYMCGVTIWNFFAAALTKTASTFTSNASIFGKVYFPRMTVPVANVIATFFSFGIQFALFLCFYIGFWIVGAVLKPNVYLLMLPVLLLIMSVLSLALGIILSALTTKYRDFTHLVSFGVQLLMYGSAVIYPLSMLSAETRNWLVFNPIVPIIELFRFAFFGQGAFEWWHIVYSGSVSVLLLIFGLMLFHKVEKNFMDTV